MNVTMMFDYRSKRSFHLALLLSLMLHALALYWKVSAPPASNGWAQPQRKQRLDIALTPSKPVTPSLSPPAPASSTPAVPPKHTRQPTRQRKSLARELLAPPQTLTEPRQWSRAEREAMENFLDELRPAHEPPKTGAEMAQQALAMAREIAREPPADEAPPVGQAGNKTVEPFSLQMYFDAFIKKLNRSAAFVKNDPASHGQHVALVKITLNPNGSLQSYRVLRSGDQEKQITYIKQVIDIAAPFAPFPDDIRRAMGGFSVLICIHPARDGEIGGNFLRSTNGSECHDN
jgi:hypothetical protein